MSSTDGGDGKVVQFRPTELPPEERARRLQVEVERLACQSLVEWMFWLPSSAEQHGIEEARLKQMVEAQVRANEKKKRETNAEERKLEQRAEKQRSDARREQECKQRAQEQAEKKEAERKQREQEKEFAKLLKLPTLEQEPRLAALAKRLDVDLDSLRDEFMELAAVEQESSEAGYVEPWPEPIDTQTLLNAMTAQLRRYVVLHDDAAAVAIVLWICFAWLHAEIAVHSPLLVITSAEGDSGKTTVCGIIQLLTPRSYAAAELTGPSLYRFIDHQHPTLIIDDADNLLERRPDLMHIINVGWTRGTKIPRQDHGVTRWFDPFCPKVIAGVNVRLSKTTATRKIAVKLLPKLPHERVAEFRHVDDDEFIALRRKLARWAADNAAALKDARPVMPTGFNNRLRMNWELLLAIADLAGGDWPKLARQAAVKLARERHEPSEGKRLLAAFRELFRAHGPMLTSAEAQRLLTADPNSEWADFRGRGRPITQREIAILLDLYEIHPDVIRPRGRKPERGYRVEWFETAFRHYLQTPTNKRSTVTQAAQTPEK
jgi:putative DNA primase/helicase